MLLIPGAIISIVTFPGVIMHEAAHQLFCRLFHLPVYKVCYFQFSSPNGYVIHEASDDPKVNFFVCVGPFLVNTLLGAVITLPSAVRMLQFGNPNPLDFVNMWLGISILMHAFPSTGDAKSLYASVIRNKSVHVLVKALVLPVIGLIYIGAYGSIVWLDLVYAIGVAYLLPNLAAGLFA